ncbi:helix-turn-helix transcriptional regulator [Acidaminobacter sp. JC074]|uniref:TetR/AcrR family transcriptional regulator n=1 Tax=Acidaminobacter sp. JC074 TaxID=2530199 RepID=UPI001F10C073|nr:TetR/AcrR family transcriptional regulator [Acidaminobacter sp. JC074]MCH4889002.1 helix-turn-helix transcriptional regulator [Acidaminobacter sp. JC074]
MTSKREEKKKYFTQKIITAAHELFIKTGYKNTTIEAIAEKAGVGRGTAYLYFKSKSELYRITMEDTLHFKNLIIELDSSDYRNTLSDTLLLYLDLYVNAVFSTNKEMMKEFALSSVGELTDTDSFIYSFYNGYDTLLKDQIVNITEHFKSKKELMESFDTEIFSDLLLKVLIEIFATYIISDYPKEKVSDHAGKQVTFMISPYLI